MTQYLPPNLLALFAPRDPIPFLPPACKLPHEKKNRGYSGVGDFLNLFEDPNETPDPVKIESKEERLERRRRERTEQVAYKLEQEIAVWDPRSNLTGTVDAYKTLFVARINYDTSENKLRREFEVFGPIKKIALIHDKITGKPRGYAFIEYEHERDMHSAYKHADGKKIDGRRVLVDVERARTVKGWLPRRLGGGLGGTRRGGADVNLKHSGREDNDRERERYRVEREGGDRVERPERRANERERERERERPEHRERPRHRSRSREKKPRRSRSRSRERKRRRSRERPEAEPEEPEERPRDRERRDRDRKRNRRSRSRERKHRRDRDRDRDKDRDRRDRDGDIDEKVRIKVEPPDDYPDYSNTNNYDGDSFDNDASIKYEKGDKAAKIENLEENGAEGSRNDTNGNGDDFDSQF